MEKFILEESFKTPAISFDSASGELSIRGRIFPENPDEFFAKVLNWLQGYAGNPAASTRMVIFLSYFNSTSSEYIFRMCKTLESIAGAGNICSIIWEYEAEDEDMKQIGEDYANLLKLNFELRAVI